MKGAKIAALALAVLFSVAAVAQTHGVPASVTSITNTRWGQTPGVPASVTSLGPRGYGGRGGVVINNPGNCGPITGLIPSALGCNTNRIFYPSVNYRTGQVEFREHHNRVPRGSTGPIYYPYPVYTQPVMEYSDYTQPEVAPPPPPVQPVQIQIVVDDKRSSAPPQEAVVERPAAPPQPATPGPEPPATVLVYRDGHREEVQNYAIVGQTLYDLGTFVAHKIPLASLDLKETIKVNEDRGTEFTLPAGYKLD